MMSPFSVLIVARVVAWAIALCALLAVLIGYDSLPSDIPVTRWTSAPKSLLIVLRVPLINLLALGLVEVLWRGLRRVDLSARAATVAAVLLLTGAAKAAIEAVGILRLPVPLSWTMAPLVAVLVIGLGVAAVLGSEFLRAQRWRGLQLSRMETAVALALVGGIAFLNLPIVLR